MGLLYDLANLDLENLSVKDLDFLNQRGAYPIVSAGRLTGFESNDGEVLYMKGARYE